MNKRQAACIVGVMAMAMSTARAQDSSAPPQSTAPASQQPVPAYGQEESTPPPVNENPPLSGLDEPGLEPHAAPLSYLQPGATVSESADSNIGNGPGGSTLRSVSRALGSLTLQRLWSHYDLALQYEGGAGYYNLKGIGWKLMQQLDMSQKITWKRGQLAFRDSFSYLPEGNFGSAYGSMGSQGIASLGNTAFGSFWGGASLGTLGIVPRIMNVSLVDVQETLSPKSSITAAGGYAFVHFYGKDQAGTPYVGNTQVSGQVGYNRIIGKHSQIALVYGYQGFDFSSVGTAFHSHVIQGLIGHRISGRMDLLIGAGPQFTSIELPGFFGTIHDQRIGVSARARLRYQFTRTSVSLSYERLETSGSGFFAGAQTDVGRFRVERPLSRVWTSFADIGYGHNSRLASLTPVQLATCVYAGQPNPNNLPLCPGVNAQTYNYGFLGVGLHRSFGHDFHGFASYEFNELSFDNSYCAPGLPCNRIGNRHVLTVGVDWTPRPIRID